MNTTKALDPLTALSLGLGVLLVGVGGVLAFLAPPDVNQGHVYRIFFIHVATAWVGMVALFVALAYSLVYLLRRDYKYDTMATACIEVALLFLTITLIGGMLWARPTWGVYWTWDPRLTTFAVLMVVYVGYFVVRSAIEDPEARAKASAAISILGSINVPIVYMSVVWWRGVHQTQTFNLLTGKIEFDAAMVPAIIANVVGFSILYFGLVRLRGKVGQREVMKLEVQHG